MFNPTRTALYLAIGAMAFAAGEASAGCKSISGTFVCATWIKGSEICRVTFDNPDSEAAHTVVCRVEGVDESGCPNGQLPSGELVCGEAPSPEPYISSAGTTSDTTRSKGKGRDRDDDEHNGKGKCRHGGKHDGWHDGRHGGHDDTECYSGVPGEGDVPPIFDGGIVTVLESPEVTAKCNRHGICKATAEVLPPEGSTCGEDGGEVIDFTADRFLATVEVCGVDGGEGGCVSLYQLCTENGNRYNCVELDGPNDFCEEY